MGYYDEIIDALTGETPQLRGIPKQRLDWSGCAAVLELYDKTWVRGDREDFIRDMGRVIEDTEDRLPPYVVAQVLHIATSLEIAQVAPNVQKLSSKVTGSKEPVKTAIGNYLAFRQLRVLP